MFKIDQNMQGTKNNTNSVTSLKGKSSQMMGTNVNPTVHLEDPVKKQTENSFPKLPQQSDI